MGILVNLLTKDSIGLLFNFALTFSNLLTINYLVQSID